MRFADVGSPTSRIVYPESRMSLVAFGIFCTQSPGVGSCVGALSSCAA